MDTGQSSLVCWLRIKIMASDMTTTRSSFDSAHLVCTLLLPSLVACHASVVDDHCSTVDDIPADDAAALRRAAETGDTEMIGLLLNKLDGLNKRTADHLQRALYLAASYGQYDAVCELLKVFVSCVSHFMLKLVKVTSVAGTFG